MTTCERDRGFTLVEVVVVLAVIGILVGTAAPLASALVEADRRQAVRTELDAIALALDEYYFDRAAFPADLRAAGFYGVHLQPGVGGTAVEDSWGGNGALYRYSVDTAANTASVWSRGENGVDDGYAGEEFRLVVHGTPPGLRKTRQRMRVIVEALALYLEGGGTLTGTWSTDRTAIGLGTAYQTDGFGVDFALDAATLVLRSAGPDRAHGTADDVTS